MEEKLQVENIHEQRLGDANTMESSRKHGSIGMEHSVPRGRRDLGDKQNHMKQLHIGRPLIGILKNN